MTLFGSSMEPTRPSNIQSRASGTRLTTAEHRTYNLPVLSGGATFYTTDAGSNSLKHIRRGGCQAYSIKDTLVPSTTRFSPYFFPLKYRLIS